MKYTKIATAVVAVLGMGFSLHAYATNGMNPEGSGVKNRGMGGAGVAMANETASIVTNPASVVDVGNRMDFSLGFFSPSPRGYTHSGGNPGFNATQESANDLFLIPFFGVTFPIDDKSAWSFVVNANGGMNTEYDRNFSSALGNRTGINLEQIFTGLTYARKINADLSFGITGILAYQRFSATGLTAFAGASSDSANLTDKGVDTSGGIGYKFGFQGNITDTLKFGMAYQPRIDMDSFDKYKGLFADQGDLDIASTVTAGLAWKMSPTMTIAFDYHYIDYRGVPSIGNSTSLFPGRSFGSMGGPGFGWNSINVYKLGVEFASSDTMAWRLGWNHGDNPITTTETSVAFLAPGIIEDHLTFGGTHKLSAVEELSFNFVHSFKNDISGDFSASFGGGTMRVEMEQNFLEMGYSKKF